MEIIERVIFNNLLRQQSIVLPKVGTLMVYREVGRFDAQTRRVIAPRSRVEFIGETPENYSTIIDLMLQEGAQRQDDVKSLYEHWVAENCSKSDVGIKIGEVGFARRTAENSFEFEPSKELRDILNPLENYSIEVPLVEKTATKVDIHPQNAKKKPNRKWQNILIIAFMVLVLVLWFCFDRNIFLEKENPMPQSVQQTVQKPKAQVKIQDSVRTEVDTAKVNTVAKVEKPKSEEIKNVGRFCIIAGLYSVEANADIKIESLGEDKKYAEKLPARKNRMYVSVRRFETRQEAEKFLNQNHKAHPDYWILEIKNKQ